MARVPLPQITSGARPSPTPGLNVSRPLGISLAGTVGAGLEGLGQSLEASSNVLAQNALKQAAEDNHAAAVNALSTFTAANAEQQNAEGGIYTLNGRNAMDGFKPALDSMHQLVGKVSDSLTNDDQRQLFAGMVGREVDYSTTQMASYTATQRRKYLVDTYGTAIKTAQQAAYANRNDPAAFENSLGQVIAAQGALDGYAGVDDATGRLNAQALISETKMQIIDRMLAEGDALGAQAKFEAWKDSMTAENATAVARAVHNAAEPQLAARDADQAVTDVLNGGGNTGARADITPASVLQGLRGNASGYIKNLTGIDVAITSARRTAEQNRAAGGSATSEHLTNQAWDMVPTRGQTMTQLAQAIVDSGIPFDQVEVTPTHVHVGLRDANLRREVIGPLASQIHSGGLAQRAAATDEPVDYELAEGQVLSRVDALAEQTHPGDVVYRDMVEGRAITQINRLKQAQAATQQSAQNRLVTAINGGPDGTGPRIDDLASLQQAYPGAAADLRSLGGAAQARIASGLRRESNLPTPERDARYAQLFYQSKMEVDNFLSTNLMNEDLTRQQRMELLRSQVNVRAHREQLKQQSDNLRTAFRDPLIASALKDAGIDSDSDAYRQFGGAVLGQIDQYRAANNGKNPPLEEIRKYANSALAQRGSWFSSHRGYEVPSDEASRITSAFRTRFNRDPTPDEVSRIYTNAGGGR